MDLLLVASAALVGSLASLIGGIYLLYDMARTNRILKYAVPFAAGALLAAAFVDLLPEAVEAAGSGEVLVWALFGIVLFFVLERGLHWFHHHHSHADDSKDANRYLIITGDVIHNLLDGIAIGAAFLVSPATGIIATFAVAAHEIPQEVGDFALLLAKGMSKRAVLAVNISSALVTVIAATSIFMLGNTVSLPIEPLLAITAGFFIYIATSDIIPSIHAEDNTTTANLQTGTLLIGIVIISLITIYAHQLTESSDDHSQDEHAIIKTAT